jgi:outer membrane translocation and assembly module TamA
VKDWYLTAFFDAGNASNDLFAKPNRGVGGGIVFRTGIGTLELTFAKALSQKGCPGRIQFSLGAEL